MDDPTRAPRPATVPPERPRTVDSGELLQGQRELLIHHHSEVYRLRLTRSGKLILQE